MKNFKKILASIGMLGVAVPTALSVVACGQDPALTAREEAVLKLTSAVTQATLVDISSWAEEDTTIWLDELKVALDFLASSIDPEEISIEVINAATARLNWQKQKFTDKYSEKVSEKKKSFSNQLARATKVFSDGLDLSEIKGKTEFAGAINNAIATYKSNDESKFEETTNNLKTATDKFVEENDIIE